MPRLYTIASRNTENVILGYQNHLWAVAHAAGATMAGRRTKSQKVQIGDYGLIYCSANGHFMMPFTFASVPDLDVVVQDIWPEPWVLPFEIHPLADPAIIVAKERAAAEWDFVAGQVPPLGDRNAVTALNATAVCAFVPVQIEDEQLAQILASFGFQR